MTIWHQEKLNVGLRYGIFGEYLFWVFWHLDLGLDYISCIPYLAWETLSWKGLAASRGLAALIPMRRRRYTCTLHAFTGAYTPRAILHLFRFIYSTFDRNFVVFDYIV